MTAQRPPDLTSSRCRSQCRSTKYLIFMAFLLEGGSQASPSTQLLNKTYKNLNLQLLSQI